MRNWFFLLLGLFGVALSGCTTDMVKQFDKVKVGMEKDQVLELMDSPQISERWHGMDRWTYIFFEDNQRYQKEVHFQDGVANYVGEIFKPEVSAEQQDTKNVESNAEVEKLIQAHHDDMNKETLENAVEGNKVRYVPQFEPVQ